MDQHLHPSETDPLLPAPRPTHKSFYRPRPLWIVPVAMIASLVRGMTLAPRVQVYTQLSCNALHRRQHHGLSGDTLPSNPSLSSILIQEQIDPPPILVYFPYAIKSSDHDSEGPRQILSQDCLSDPTVQADAARLQATMATITGILTLCSTTWWGHYGQKHGRTKVLATSTLGLLTTDVAFAIASTTASPLSRHGYKLLLFAPIVEGILGSHATLQAAISAYISDCTSDGSRAHIFSRFLGVSYLGLSLGPTLGAFLIRHPFLQTQSFGQKHGQMHSVTAAFWAAILCSAINFILTLLIVPESLDKAKRFAPPKVDDPVHATQKKSGLRKRLLAPLTVFAPRRRFVNGRMEEDWSMCWLATGVFLLFLASGVFQLKYLYAEHVFRWDAEQMGYYVSFIGAVRALHGLLLMPFLISTFKPSSQVPSASISELRSSVTSAHIARSITFDLCVARGSLLLEFTSHSLVAFHISSSPLVFAGVTSISALASGTHPALQSLAICIFQRSRPANAEIGALFGGLSMLTALGQILAPLMFGMVYSTTVAHFPEAIFALAAALVLVSLGSTFLVRTEPPRVWKGKAPAVAARHRILAPERERGRSRAIKHIGDRIRKPARGSAPAPNNVGARAGESTAFSSHAGPSDEAV
ncbi:MFS general substrate transporter [Russula earlei]|uniref:MFS general substrate transporter n=1 Tax=Russula earlei TaxID=71964 RepID=A0ACC0UGS8_9AGAM|nr:MFS general substrate transporter [Russula earlei]